MRIMAAPSMGLAMALVCLSPCALAARGGADGVERSNALYAAGEYAQAAQTLDGLIRDAGLDRELAAVAQFNLGAALYRQARFAQARDAWERAALLTRVLSLSVRATYNIGNALVRESEEHLGAGNLDQAAETLEAGITAYRRTLELEPDKHEAAANLEVARTMLKGVRDELARYEDVRRLQRQIVEALKTRVQEQADALRANEDHMRNTTAVLSAQTLVRDRTAALPALYDALLQHLRRLQARVQSGNPYTESRRHVVESLTLQDLALRLLGTGDRNGVSDPQASSLEELRTALAILSPPANPDRGEQGSGDRQAGSPDRSPQGQSELPRQGSAPGPESGREDGSPTAQQAEGSSAPGGWGSTLLDESPEDILREEGALRRSRDRDRDTTGVDKDW